MSAEESTAVTVDLGSSAGEVDRYATQRGLSRDAAVLELVRAGLSGPVRNSVTGSTGTVIQAGDVKGDISF